jgi:L-seryl-tRNA(Ser) seleniumtransferase
MLGLLLERARLLSERCPITPAEAVTAVGMLLLAEHGIVTVNALSLAGARPSLRLKPTADAVEALGGPEALASAVERAMEQVAARLPEPGAVAALILG